MWSVVNVNNASSTVFNYRCIVFSATHKDSPITNHQSPITNHQSPRGKQVIVRYRRSHYTAAEQVEWDRIIGNIKRHIRESFTLKKIINPGWKQWGMRIACFSIVHFRHGLHRVKTQLINDRGDVPGWVLVVLMTTGLVTAIWTLAAPRIQSILRTSLDSMNNIR